MSNVIPLLGYGKMPLRVKILKESEAPESNIVTQNEILNLQRDLNLSNDQLHNICQFMKRKGLRTPNTRITQALKKQNVIDLFESAIVELEDNNGDKSPTEVVYGILGFREKLLDRIPMKLLGKEEYTRFEEAFIIP